MQLPLSRSKPPRPITVAGAIYPDDEVVIFSPATAIGVTLPSAAGQRNALYLYNTGANDDPITLTPSGGTINGGANFVWTGPDSGMLLIPDGISNWMAVGQSINTGLATFAPLDSPAFTGTPTAPSAAVNTSTTQLATTAFVGVQRSALATTITYNNVGVLAATALSVTVEAGKTYAIALVVHNTSAVKGLLLDFAGTATITSFIGQWTSYDITDATAANTTHVAAAGTDYPAQDFDSFITLQGSVVINAAGTFLLRGAQNVADVSNTTILAGSTLVLTKMN